jgi:hypothetical protein
LVEVAEAALATFVSLGIPGFATTTGTGFLTEEAAEGCSATIN